MCFNSRILIYHKYASRKFFVSAVISSIVCETLSHKVRKHTLRTGEGKRRKEFAEWYVEWRAEWHNYAKYDLRGE